MLWVSKHDIDDTPFNLFNNSMKWEILGNYLYVTIKEISAVRCIDFHETKYYQISRLRIKFKPKDFTIILLYVIFFCKG